MNLLKSLLHNAGVIIVGFGVALIGSKIDSLFHIHGFHSLVSKAMGWLLLALGFFLRVWATWYFYERQMKVIELAPQTKLITTGPYRISRNPLYLGGNVLIFFGAAWVLGSPTALVLIALHLPLMDLFIRREERQLERTFGEEWVKYKDHVRRWV